MEIDLNLRQHLNHRDAMKEGSRSVVDHRNGPSQTASTTRGKTHSHKRRDPKLKSCKDDEKIARGKRVTSATPGNPAQKNPSPPPRGRGQAEEAYSTAIRHMLRLCYNEAHIDADPGRYGYGQAWRKTHRFKAAIPHEVNAAPRSPRATRALGKTSTRPERPGHRNATTAERLSTGAPGT